MSDFEQTEGGNGAHRDPSTPEKSSADTEAVAPTAETAEAAERDSEVRERLRSFKQELLSKFPPQTAQSIYKDTKVRLRQGKPVYDLKGQSLTDAEKNAAPPSDGKTPSNKN